MYVLANPINTLYSGSGRLAISASFYYEKYGDFSDIKLRYQDVEYPGTNVYWDNRRVSSIEGSLVLAEHERIVRVNIQITTLVSSRFELII